MIKTLATAVTLASTLALGITTAQAHTAPRAHASQVSVKRVCKPARTHSAARCQAVAVRRAHAALTGAPSLLAQSASTAYSATVSWPAVTGSSSTRVYVDGHLLDQFATSPTDSYQIQGLWPATSFAVTVELDGVTASTPVRYTRTITTAARTTAFPRLYSPTAFINTPIAANPALAPNSAAIVSEAITNYSQSANLANDNAWGIPIINASPQSPSYTVGCQYYWCNTSFANVRIPTSATPDTGSDGHLVVIQPDGGEMDMWIAQHTNTGWSAGTRWLSSANGPAANCSTQHACGGADVANFALAAGVVRPEEIAQGHIDHALAITTPDTRQGYIACPATNSDGKHTSPNALPIGTHLQLNPTINVNNLQIPAWQKVIATALQKYGAYVVDTGGSVGIYAQANNGRPYNAWAKAGITDNAPSLSDLPWHSMRVLNMTQCGS